MADLEKHGIRFTDLVLVNSFEAKAQVIAERGVSFYNDDQPVMPKNIPPKVGVRLRERELDVQRSNGESGVDRLTSVKMAG